MSGFSFGGGSSKPASGGFSFGGAAPAASSTPASGGFSFGGASSTTAPATTAPSGGLFGGGGASALPKPAGGLFGGGAAAPAATTSSGGLSFGASASKPAGGLFGAATTTAQATTASSGGLFGGGGASALPKPAGLFGAGSAAPATTTAPASTGLSFGAQPATTSAGFSLGAAPAAASTAASALPTPSLSFATPKAATTTAPSFTLGAKSSTPATSAASVPKPAGLSFGAAKPATATTSAAATTTTSSLLGAKPAEKTPTMTWGELDSKISRWNTEIHNQSQTFIKQATQVNAWTGILIQNGEKIAEINDELATVKKHQAKLDQELDRVAAQQNDLETILGPLEETAKKQKQINSLAHNVDNERERTFALAGSVDAQIKALALELREVIERVNSTHGEGEGSLVAQLTHILSSHTDALQWVEEESATLQRRLEQVSRGVDAKAAIH